jgi:malonate-semialdehyde dehydrogenase (acetylating) / methylmalonate-semialdehyde dehydrogenase
MKELTHFVGGKHATGTSGRFCDGFEPMTRYVQLLKPPLPPSLLEPLQNPQRRARVLIEIL